MASGDAPNIHVNMSGDSMNYTIGLVIRIVIATVLAVILGNGSVVAFNHLPQKWFEDWADDGSNSDGDGQSGSDEPSRVLPPRLLQADDNGMQRLPSTPWKYTFTGLFGIAGIYLAITEGLQYELGTMLVLGVVLEMAICDQMYRIVPDQLQIMLAVSALGFLGYGETWWEPLAGAGIGLALGMSVYGLGRLIYRSSTIGGADIKFYVGVGLVVGRAGVIIIFVLTTLLFCIQGAVRTMTHRGSMKDANAMLPAGFAAVLIYMLFLWNSAGILGF